MKSVTSPGLFVVFLLALVPTKSYCQAAHRNPFPNSHAISASPGGGNSVHRAAVAKAAVVLSGSRPQILSVQAPDTLERPESGFSLFAVEAIVADSDGLQDVDSVWFRSPNSTSAENTFFLTNRGGGVWSDTFQVSSQNNPGAYPFVFRAVDKEGNLSDSLVHVVVIVGTPTVVPGQLTPSRFQLFQNYPNPFNPSTTFSFTLNAESFVSLKVYDVLGREVATLAFEHLLPGAHSRYWNAVTVPSGVYIGRLQAGAFSSTIKVMLIK